MPKPQRFARFFSQPLPADVLPKSARNPGRDFLPNGFLLA